VINQYYENRCLLVTGGTGFLGLALIVKVLRDLPQVRKVYALLRTRRGSDGQVVCASERLQQEVFEGEAFASFRAADPEGFARARQKVVAVGGDISVPNLGIDPVQRQELLDEVDTIFTIAATVVFDEPLDDSIRLNTHGPLALLELAHESSRDVDFVHVSTAYVNGQMSGRVPEELLPQDRNISQLMEAGANGRFDPQVEIADCESFCRGLYEEAASEPRNREFRQAVLAQSRRRELTDARLKQLIEDRRKRWLERRLIGEGMRRAKEYGWNDVYTFTKAMGEQMLVKKRGDTALVIVRPSIIESSLEEPAPGWITGLKVMDPLVAAYGKGVMPDFPARRDLILDLIPVDIVVNATLAAATQATSSEVSVFQVASSTENPVRLATLFDNVRAHFLQYPLRDRDGRAPNLRQWTYSSLRKFKLIFRLRYLYPLRLQEWIFNRLPDAMVSEQRRRLVATLKIRLQRVLHYTDLYYPYTSRECAFETRRTRALFQALPPEEQKVFNMDVKRIDWPSYVRDIHVPGLRRYVIKDVDGAAFFPQAPEEPEGDLAANRQIEES
jgi:fatty acyl-CoA reductase